MKWQKQNEKHLKHHILTTFLFLIISIIVISSVINLINSLFYINRETSTALENSNVKHKLQIESFLLEQEATLNALAAEIEANKNYNNKATMENYLNMRMKAYPHVLSIFMGKNDGTMIDATHWVPEKGYIPSERDWYKNAVGTDKSVFTDPYIDSATGSPIISVSKRITLDNKVVGVLGIDITVDNIVKFIHASKQNNGSYVFVSDSKGDIIIHPTKELSPINGKFKSLLTVNNGKFSKLSNSITSNNSNTVTIKDLDGIKKYFTFKTIDKTGWKVVSNYPTNYKTTAIILEIIKVVIILIVFILLAIIKISRFSNKYITPIESIRNILINFSSGKLKVNTSNIEANSLEVKDLISSIKLMSNKLSGYIDEISIVLDRVSNGDFRVEINDNFEGDFSPISGSLKNIVSSLSNTLLTINLAADKVSNSSKNVSLTAKILSDGSSEQASAVEVLNLSLTNISEHTKINASSTQTLATISEDFNIKANKTKEHIKEMLVSMDDINISSNNIANIIKVIEDIAFETNILALNATIEATKAGSAGSGFAVVAEEVKALAARSAEASKNTSILIKGSIEKVNIGNKLAYSVARIIDNMIEEISRFSYLTSNINTATKEQVQSIIEVTKSIGKISSILQTYADASEKTTFSSNEFLLQSKELKNLVDKFKLKEFNN